MSTTLSTGGLLKCARSSPGSCCLVATISDAFHAHVRHCVLRPIIRALERDNLVARVSLKIILVVVHAARDVELLFVDTNLLVVLVVLTLATSWAPLHWNCRGALTRPLGYAAPRAARGSALLHWGSESCVSVATVWAWMRHVAISLVVHSVRGPTGEVHSVRGPTGSYVRASWSVCCLKLLPWHLGAHPAKAWTSNTLGSAHISQSSTQKCTHLLDWSTWWSLLWSLSRACAFCSKRVRRRVGPV